MPKPALLIVLGMALLPSGCAVFQPVKKVNDHIVRSLRPNPHGYKDSTQDETDEWSYVGKEARGTTPPQSERDPLRNWMTSPKARSIEANLGIYD